MGKVRRRSNWSKLGRVAKGKVARCTCKCEVLEDAFKVPETGSIGLEADRGQMEYRNIRLKETK